MLDNLYKLSIGSALKIKGEEFFVYGIIEFEQGRYKWKEYNLKNNSRESFWLSVEFVNDEPILMFYHIVKGVITPANEVVYDNETYTIFEKGEARVTARFGNIGVDKTDKVLFFEYRSADGKKLLTYEEWSYKDKELSIGSFITGADVKILDKELAKEKKDKDVQTSANYFKALYNMKNGQYIKINGTEYCVEGFLEFRQQRFSWKEYAISDAKGRVLWLSVEKDQAEIILGLYQVVKRNFSPDKTVLWDNETYTLTDQGKGTVSSQSGTATDIGEVVNFSEYENKDATKLLSYEAWEDEVEVSTGICVSPDQIEIMEGHSAKMSILGSSAQLPRVHRQFLSVGLLVLLALTCAGLMLTSFLVNHSLLEKLLQSDSNFQYATSVTDTVNRNQKANVYATELTVDETCKYLIHALPEKIQSVHTFSEKETPEDEDITNASLQTKYEFALVYQNDEEKTYVQISTIQYAGTTHTGVYRPRYHHSTSSFFRSSGSGQKTVETDSGGTRTIGGKFDTYLSSARAESIATRKASGGGISFGK